MSVEYSSCVFYIKIIYNINIIIAVNLLTDFSFTLFFIFIKKNLQKRRKGLVIIKKICYNVSDYKIWIIRFFIL